MAEPKPIPDDALMAHVQGYALGYEAGYIYAHSWDIDEEWNLLAQEDGTAASGTSDSGLDHAARSARTPLADARGSACSSPPSADPSPQDAALLAEGKYVDAIQQGMIAAFAQASMLFRTQEMYVAASMMERAAEVVTQVRSWGQS